MFFRPSPNHGKEVAAILWVCPPSEEMRCNPSGFPSLDGRGQRGGREGEGKVPEDFFDEFLRPDTTGNIFPDPSIFDTPEIAEQAEEREQADENAYADGPRGSEVLG